MVAVTDDISRKEHLLAEKAQGILEHQQQLESLEKQKEELQQKKPTAGKQQLSYEESLQFGEQIRKYEKKLQGIEVQIQKLTRELNALKLQAKKLLPVSEINVRVSTKGAPCQTFCIKHIKEESESQPGEHFKVEKLSQ